MEGITVVHMIEMAFLQIIEKSIIENSPVGIIIEFGLMVIGNITEELRERSGMTVIGWLDKKTTNGFQDITISTLVKGLGLLVGGLYVKTPFL
jgi:hypothetical protein